MVDKEITRFHYEGWEYQIHHLIYKYGDKKISSPYISLGYKSSKKKRGKLTSRYDNKFKLTDLKSPVGLVRKIMKILDIALQDFDYVCYYPYEDKLDKRGSFYVKVLDQIGFPLLWSDGFWFFHARKGHEIKKKEACILVEKIYTEITE